jgi:hypothetical protein
MRRHEKLRKKETKRRREGPEKVPTLSAIFSCLLPLLAVAVAKVRETPGQ